MAGQTSQCNKTYTIDDTEGVGQFVAVVQGAAAGGCKTPAAANAPKFLGFTQEAQPLQHKGVTVQISGISRAIASGVISAGDAVCIDGATGKVASCQADVEAAPGTAKIIRVIGQAESTAAADGDTVLVRICPYVAKTAAS